MDDKPGFKDLFGMIKKSPALMITFIGGGILLLYIVAKHGAGNQNTTKSTSGDVPGTVAQGSYYTQEPQFIGIPVYTQQTQTGVGGGTAATQTSDPSAGVPTVVLPSNTPPPSSGNGSMTIPSLTNDLNIIRAYGFGQYIPTNFNVTQSTGDGGSTTYQSISNNQTGQSNVKQANIKNTSTFTR